MTEAKSQSYKKNKIILIVFVVLYSSFLLSGYCFAESQANDGNNQSTKLNISSNVDWLMFSSIQHSYERNLVKNYEHISARDLKNGRIYISLADLNGDGVKEIIAYIEIFDYCGQQLGCPFNIYKMENKKLRSLLRHDFVHGFPMFIEIDNTGKQRIVGILSNKTLGWHDVTVDSKTIWKWNGESY